MLKHISTAAIFILFLSGCNLDIKNTVADELAAEENCLIKPVDIESRSIFSEKVFNFRFQNKIECRTKLQNLFGERGECLTYGDSLTCRFENGDSLIYREIQQEILIEYLT